MSNASLNFMLPGFRTLLTLNILLYANFVYSESGYFVLPGDITFPDFMGGEDRQVVFPGKQFQSPDMIRMHMCYQYTHNSLHGYAIFLQGFANSACWNSCIYQYAIALITKAITVSSAAATKTAKIQFHHCFFERGQRYI